MKITKVDHNDYYTSEDWTEQANSVVTCKRGEYWYYICDDRMGVRMAQRGSENEDDVYLGVTCHGDMVAAHSPFEKGINYWCSLEEAIKRCEIDYAAISGKTKTNGDDNEHAR